MTKKKRLGRGLDALLSKPIADTAAVTGRESDSLKTIPVDLLQRGQYQPRLDMRQDTLEDLAKSISAQGVVQPIVVRPIGSERGKSQRYEIVAGERRWRAAQMAGIEEIPAVVRDVPDDAAIAMASIDSNARAWPISSCRDSSIGLTLSDSSSRRSRLLTDARLRPTASAACWCVRSNSRISRSSARASSSGFRSSRWKFSDC